MARSALRLWVLGVLVLAGGVTACANTVIVEDEDALAGGAANGAGAGSGGVDCVACEDGDCALCDDPASGLLIYRCPTQELPPGSGSCVQTGSLFHDEAYGYYVCWRCGPL